MLHSLKRFGPPLTEVLYPMTASLGTTPRPGPRVSKQPFVSTYLLFNGRAIRLANPSPLEGHSSLLWDWLLLAIHLLQYDSNADRLP